MAIVGMTFILAIVWRRDGRRHCGNSAPRSLAVDRVDVTKGQAKVYGQRNQRQPCTLPDGVPKPAHSSCNVLPPSAATQYYLSYDLRQLSVHGRAAPDSRAWVTKTPNACFEPGNRAWRLAPPSRVHRRRSMT
jgi:hypothetical protein